MSSALEDRNPPMNRTIVMFAVLFVGVFGGAYLMMQGLNRPAASPSSDPVAKLADTSGAPIAESGAKNDEGKPESTTAGGESKAMRDESKSLHDKAADGSKSNESDTKSSSPKSAGDATSKSGDGEKNLPKIVTYPSPSDSQPRTSNKRRHVTKRTVENFRPASPASPANDVPDEDLDHLQGTWQVIAAENEGESNKEEAKQYTWDFQANKYTINCNGKFAELYTVKLNSGTKPKTIDSTFHLGGKLMGIYEINGDTLKICYDLTRRGRPESFTAPKGSRRVVYILQRQ
jgi:uncharacterized protein (TIGR03067 family)